MCEYFCIGFIDFMLKRKSLLLLLFNMELFTLLLIKVYKIFFPNDYEKNDKIMLKYFQ